MAKPEVTLTFAGDAKDLERAAERAERAMRDVGDAVDEAAIDIRSSSAKIDDGFSSIGDSVDTGEQRILGAKDTIDGVATIMQGPGEQGIASYLQGWADLSSGIVNFALPALQNGIKATLASGKASLISAGQTVQASAMKVAAWVRQAAAAVANAAKVVASWVMTGLAAIKAGAQAAAAALRQVAAWVLLGAQSLLQAAKVAAAWLISMGPIAIVIAAVVGLVVIIVRNWDTIVSVIKGAGERLLGIAKGAWDAIKGAITGAISGIVGFLRGAVDKWVDLYIRLPLRIAQGLGSLAETIKAPFRNAMNWVIDKWNNFRIPSFNLGFGLSTPQINTPNLRRFAAGGIVPGPAGAEVPIMAHAGERITPAGSVRAGGGGEAMTINLTVNALDPTTAGEVVVQALEDFVRDRGPARIGALA